MKTKYTAWAAVGASLLVAACGGGGGDGDQSPKVSVSSLVSFGDSLSDVGNAQVGTVKALGGGQWTVNGASTKNWTAYVAAQYGLPAPCSAQTGLTPAAALVSAGFVGAAVANNASCLNYAQGSSRVTSPFGPNSYAIQAALNAALAGAGDAAAPLGLTALPIKNQIDNHIAAHGFTGNELVTVLGGANDIFLNLNAIGSASAGGSTAATQAQLAGWSASVQAAVFAGGAAATTAATQAALAYMTATADELSGYIKTKIVGNGAKRVLVFNMPYLEGTPYALSTPAAIPLINLIVTTYNSRLQSNLAGAAGVHFVDLYSNNRDQIQNPAQYGFTNVTTPACSTTSAANPLHGSSLTCTAASTIAGDTSSYFFADTVHPTQYEYQYIGKLANKELLIAGWQ